MIKVLSQFIFNKYALRTLIGLFVDPTCSKFTSYFVSIFIKYLTRYIITTAPFITMSNNHKSSKFKSWKWKNEYENSWELRIINNSALMCWIGIVVEGELKKWNMLKLIVIIGNSELLITLLIEKIDVLQVLHFNSI